MIDALRTALTMIGEESHGNGGAHKARERIRSPSRRRAWSAPSRSSPSSARRD